MDAVRALVARFEASRAALPDLTGLDWALDHGWIERSEHEAAEERHRAHAALCAGLRKELAALRSAEPHAYEEAARDGVIAAAIAAIEAWRAP